MGKSLAEWKPGDPMINEGDYWQDPNYKAEDPEKEKMVIVLYYHEDLTFKEIGEVLEVSESRISQLHTKANLRLRAKLTNLRKGII